MQQSIKRTLNIQIGLVIFSASIIIGAILFMVSLRLSENHFQKTIQIQSKQLADAFAQHLWTFDYTSADHLGSLAVDYPDIIGLRLVNENHDAVIEKGRPDSPAAFLLKRELRFENGERGGHVELAFVNSAGEKQRHYIVFFGLCMVALAIMITFIFISSLLKRHLVAPLEKLQKDMDSLADGEFRQSAVSGQKKEIQSIIDVFNRMSAALAGREKTVRQSEEKYRSLFENTGTATFVSDQDMVITEVNENCLKLMGYSRKEIVGKMKTSDWVPAGALERITSCHGGSGESNKRVPGEYEVSVLGKDQKKIQAVIQVGMIPGTGQSIASIIDITHLKQAQKALSQSEQRYREIVEGTENLVTEVDARGRFTFVNEASYRVFGLGPRACVGKTAFDFVHPQDREKTIRKFSNWLEKKQSAATFENRQVSLSGRVTDMLWSIKIHYDDRGRVSSLKSIARDITDRRKMEKALNISNARVHSIFKSAPVGIGMVVDRVITHVNNHLVRMTGYGRDEILGRSSRFLYLSREEFDRVGTVKYDQINRYGIGTMETLWQKKDGAVIQILLSSAPLDPEDLAAGVTFTALDITKRKAAEKELATYREHLEELVENRTVELRETNLALERAKAEAEKANMAKSEFLANMSHEIRTPLNAVTGFSELLTPLVADEKQKSYLSAIKGAGRNLLTLINDILDLSKIEAGKLEIQYNTVDLKTILEEVEQIFSLQMSRKGLELITHIEADFPRTLEIDEIRLRQILLNLVGNAVKFTEKGHIMVRGETRGQREDHGKMDILISVEDTGMGVPEKEQARIFDAFAQQSDQDPSQFSGTGLGLAICKRLAEMMNGTISLESARGRGSIFRILIRDVAVSYGDTPILEPGVEYGNIRFEKGRVLVVDDIASNRFLLAELLSRANLDVLTAQNGHEAMVISPEYQPDLILMDIRMPVMNGFEAARQIRKDPGTRHIPILAVTATSPSVTPSQMREKGFAALLTKPIHIESLFNTLSRYLTPSPSRGEGADLSAPAGEAPAEEMPALSHEGIEHLISKLESQYAEQWKKMHSHLPVKEVRAFAGELAATGEAFGVEWLREYGRRLLVAANHFEVTSMREIIDAFPGILTRLKAAKEEKR